MEQARERVKKYIICEVECQEFLTEDGLLCRPVGGEPWEEMWVDYSRVFTSGEKDKPEVEKGA